MKEKILVYKVKDGEIKAVQCDEMKYPNHDSDGDKIYVNTHFLTRDGAYQRAMEESEANIRSLADQINDTRKETQTLEKKLADECIRSNRLRVEQRMAP